MSTRAAELINATVIPLVEIENAHELVDTPCALQTTLIPTWNKSNTVGISAYFLSPRWSKREKQRQERRCVTKVLSTASGKEQDWGMPNGGGDLLAMKAAVQMSSTALPPSLPVLYMCADVHVEELCRCTP